MILCRSELVARQRKKGEAAVAGRSFSSYKKRQKELARMEKQREKAARRFERRQKKHQEISSGEGTAATEVEVTPAEGPGV